MENTSVIIAVSGLSFLMTVIWGDPLIRLLKAWRIGKIIREDGPDQHIVKMDTPTMGGIMFMIPVTLLTILFNAVSIFGFNLLGRSVLLPVFTMWAYALLGMIDDWEGIRGPRRGLGMRASTNSLIIQVLFAVAIAFALRDLLDVPQLYWFTSEEVINLGPFYIPIAVLHHRWDVQCGEFHRWTGRPGRADFGYGLCRFWHGCPRAGTELSWPGSVSHWWAHYSVSYGSMCTPPRLFMGDTGSLALGATLGVVALMTGQWLIIPLIAVIPVSEALSVVIQVLYFKATKGKRFFRDGTAAPSF